MDLGCGPGNVTARLAARWPEALVSGLDSSPEMIAAARADFPGIRFDVGEIEAWSGSPGKTDVVFSNAALHWVGDHEQLFPRLLGQVAPGGYLAVQMPLSFKEPSHTLAAELAADPEWAPKLDEALPRSPVAEPVDYHRWLAPVSSHLDVWETTYVHELTGPDPVFEWFRGSWLRPVLSRLDADEAGEFERRYRLALADHYPPDPSGAVLLPFRRVFVVASPEPSAASFG